MVIITSTRPFVWIFCQWAMVERVVDQIKNSAAIRELFMRYSSRNQSSRSENSRNLSTTGKAKSNSYLLWCVSLCFPIFNGFQNFRTSLHFGKLNFRTKVSPTVWWCAGTMYFSKLDICLLGDEIGFVRGLWCLPVQVAKTFKLRFGVKARNTASTKRFCAWAVHEHPLYGGTRKFPRTKPISSPKQIEFITSFIEKMTKQVSVQLMRSNYEMLRRSILWHIRRSAYSNNSFDNLHTWWSTVFGSS